MVLYLYSSVFYIFVFNKIGQLGKIRSKLNVFSPLFACRKWWNGNGRAALRADVFDLRLDNTL